MHLAAMQRAFQHYVLNEEPSIAAVIQSSEDFPATTRLRVYADAYRLRLIDALAHNYPRLQQLLGQAAFAQLALEYLVALPSTNNSVRWFGDRLAAHLSQASSYREQPWLAELARWEWATAAAFDAADEQPLTLEAFTESGAIGWEPLYLQFHASVQILCLTTNAAQLDQQLVNELPPAAAAVLDRPQDWLIWREEIVRYRPMQAAEARAMARARTGTFADLCETLCEFHDAAQVPLIAAGMLKAWLTQGLIVAVRPEHAR